MPFTVEQISDDIIQVNNTPITTFQIDVTSFRINTKTGYRTAVVSPDSPAINDFHIKMDESSIEWCKKCYERYLPKISHSS